MKAAKPYDAEQQIKKTVVSMLDNAGTFLVGKKFDQAGELAQKLIISLVNMQLPQGVSCFP